MGGAGGVGGAGNVRGRCRRSWRCSIRSWWDRECKEGRKGVREREVWGGESGA